MGNMARVLLWHGSLGKSRLGNVGNGLEPLRCVDIVHTVSEGPDRVRSESYEVFCEREGKGDCRKYHFDLDGWLGLPQIWVQDVRTGDVTLTTGGAE
jgi:hypothetical protein